MAEDKKKKEVKKEDLAQKLLKTISDVEDSAELERIIRDNKIVFKVKEKNYRVGRPTNAQQVEVESFRRKKYFELINDKTMLFRKQWIEKYKKKGIDIDKIEKDMTSLRNEEEKLMLKLAQTTKEEDAKMLEKEIDKLTEQRTELDIEKTKLLGYSIEDQLVYIVITYYAYVMLEEEKEKWVKSFPDYETFMNSDNSELMNKTFYYVNLIIYNPLMEEYGKDNKKIS